MNRLTPELVKTAFERLEFRPCRYSMESAGPGSECCALEAVAVLNGRGGHGFPVGLSESYCIGFFHAWDRDEEWEVRNSRNHRGGEALEHWDAGYEDGLACAAACGM